MSDLQVFLDDVRSGVATLLKDYITSEAHNAQLIAQDFVNRSEEHLKRWTALLVQGQINQADYESLVRGVAGLAEMKALQQLGLAQAKLDQLKGRIVDTIVGSAIRLAH